MWTQSHAARLLLLLRGRVQQQAGAAGSLPCRKQRFRALPACAAWCPQRGRRAGSGCAAALVCAGANWMCARISARRSRRRRKYARKPNGRAHGHHHGRRGPAPHHHQRPAPPHLFLHLQARASRPCAGLRCSPLAAAKARAPPPPPHARRHLSADEAARAATVHSHWHDAQVLDDALLWRHHLAQDWLQDEARGPAGPAPSYRWGRTRGARRARARVIHRGPSAWPHSHPHMHAPTHALAPTPAHPRMTAGPRTRSGRPRSPAPPTTARTHSAPSLRGRSSRCGARSHCWCLCPLFVPTVRVCAHNSRHKHMPTAGVGAQRVRPCAF